MALPDAQAENALFENVKYVPGRRALPDGTPRGAVNELMEFLRTIPAGSVEDPGAVVRIEALLAQCWHELEGGDEEGMEGSKLRDRMYVVRWDPPVLSFEIERHGGTVLNSTRAERHRWEVDVRTKTASCVVAGHKQLVPMQPRLDTRPIADELARKILAGEDDHRLQWLKGSKAKVRIRFSNIAGLDHGFAQTLQGRRRRLKEALERRVAGAGWIPSGAWWVKDRSSGGRGSGA